MGYTVRIPNGIISMAYVDFKCPKCEKSYSEEDYYDQLSKSKSGLIYKTCKCCKEKLGITYDMMGDVVVWLKSEEQKSNGQLDGLRKREV